MAIDTEHEEYTLRKIQWSKLRDCIAGQEAVHSAGTKYLPKLSGQTDADYKAYLGRGVFYGATSRTLDGLSGMVFRKEPKVEVPTGMNDIIEDITLGGLSLLGFAEQIIDDDIAVGRAGILVDHPSVEADTSKAQAEASNIRPFMKHYSAEQIFNWKTEGRNNAQVLTQLRLWEWVEIQGETEFDVSTRKQIRILDFNEENQYRQRVFVKSENATNREDEWVQEGDDVVPLMNGAALDVIPFFFVNVKNGDATTEKPPLIDMANVNLSHFVSTADLEHGAHFTGLPTAVITGFQEDLVDSGKQAEFRIGAATAWVFPDPETEVKYLEFEGQGLEALEKRVLKKEEYMAFLGARMLTPEKKAVETAETAQIHRSGETSVLSSLAQAAAESIEKALAFMSKWAGFDGVVVFELNKDFLAVPMSAQQLTALIGAWQAGGMAFVDLLDNMKRGEIIREDRTEDDIKSEVEQQNPFRAEDLENDTE